jgi:hypothetical protein
MKSLLYLSLERASIDSLQALSCLAQSSLSHNAGLASVVSVRASWTCGTSGSIDPPDLGSCLSEPGLWASPRLQEIEATCSLCALDLTGVQFAMSSCQTLQHGQWMPTAEGLEVANQRVFDSHANLVALKLPFALMHWAAHHGMCCLSRLQHLDISKEGLQSQGSPKDTSPHNVHSVLKPILSRLADAVTACPACTRAQTSSKIAALQGVPGWDRLMNGSSLFRHAPFHVAVDVELLIPDGGHTREHWLTAASKVWTLPGCALTFRHCTMDGRWHGHDAPITIWEPGAPPSVCVAHVMVTFITACIPELGHLELNGIPDSAVLVKRLANFPLQSLHLSGVTGQESFPSPCSSSEMPEISFLSQVPCATIVSREGLPRLSALSLDWEICVGVLHYFVHSPCLAYAKATTCSALLLCVSKPCIRYFASITARGYAWRTEEGDLSLLTATSCAWGL